MGHVFLIHVLPAITYIIIGVGLMVMREVGKLHDKFPSYGLWATFTLFLQKEWDMLIKSAIILLLYLLVIAICYYTHTYPSDSLFWNIIILYGSAILTGFAGARLVYKGLDKMERVVGQKIDTFNGGDEPAPADNNKP